VAAESRWPLMWVKLKMKIKEQIEEYIKEEVNPALEAHGGFIILEKYDEDSKTLSIMMGGGCQGCASAPATLRLMVTHAIKGRFPEVRHIEDITEHSAGQNPYY